jgi:hypothetical protein
LRRKFTVLKIACKAIIQFQCQILIVSHRNKILFLFQRRNSWALSRAKCEKPNQQKNVKRNSPNFRLILWNVWSQQLSIEKSSEWREK